MRPYPAVANATALLLTVLSLAACGGGGGSLSTPSAITSGGKGIAVGEPAPGAPALDEFIAQARTADCAEGRNRLFVIDNELVIWDRAGNCPDMSWNVTLYRTAPGAMLCTAGDSIGGPVTTCKDAHFRPLLATAVANLDKADLGLGASHKVEPVPFARNGTLPFAPLLQENFSGITEPRNVVIRDSASFQELWNAHYLGRSPVPPLPRVDFGRSMVVGVFAGALANGCRSVAVTGVTGEGDKVFVEYEIGTLMTVGPCTEVGTAPMALAVVDRHDGAVDFASTMPEHMPFTSVDLSTDSAIMAPETAVVRDEAAWTALWTRHKGNFLPPLPVPQVDFSRYMVVGVFAGSKMNGCHGTTVAGVHRSGRKIHVTRIDREPAQAQVCTQAITAPAHLIVIERSNLPVVVSSHTVT